MSRILVSTGFAGLLSRRLRVRLGISLGLLAVAVPGALAAQETGVIQGTVTEVGTELPLGGVQVVVTGTSLGTVTNRSGQYRIANVPAGTHTVRVTLIGYAETERSVTLDAGETETLNIRVEVAAVALQEIVVTGVSGATVRAKVPFDVASVGSQDLPVPSVNAASAIQGKVAGATVVAGSGRPGSSPSILLRGPTSINAAGRDQEPLYIVDGVILSEGTVDLGSLDIESIEVVKGAAAASLYGSRAANGVVQIRTQRGASTPDNSVRYSIRSELGQSDMASTPDLLLADYHPYALTENGQEFVTPTGDTCAWLECPSRQLAGQRASAGEVANEWNTYQVNAWPGQTYDHVDRFFETGSFLQNYLSASGRSGATNFHVSFSNLADEGVIPGQDGFERNNFRVNIDQAMEANLGVSASAFFSKSRADQIETTNVSPLFALTRMPAGVDLFACENDPTQSCVDRPDSVVLLPDPNNDEGVNPAYTVINRDFFDDRSRFLGSLGLRWAPLSWLDVSGDVSYDRLALFQEQYYPKGWRDPADDPILVNGNLFRYNAVNEALNGSVTGTMRFQLNDAISNRTQLRYLYEQQDFSFDWTSAYEMGIAGIRDFGNFNPANISANSYAAPIRADGYFAITNFDILDRYVIDALIRNDGSSLFGSDEQRQWYWRLAGAWRVGEEAWFALPAIDELKVRASYGTAGGRPQFNAQYETFSVARGSVVPIALGNEHLKPEYSQEFETGIDAAFLEGRLVAGVTFAHAVTEDQILPVPLPGFSGYLTQWQNAGTLTSDTWEGTLNARILDRGSFNWRAALTFARTRSEITALNVPPFTYGDDDYPVGGQELNRIFYAREGEQLGTFYGVQYATGCEHLPAGMSCDGFARNNDGYLVYVGAGSLSDNAWGADAAQDVRDAAPHLAGLKWGTPFRGVCQDRQTGEETLYCPLGNALPDYNVTLSSTVSWAGFSLYGLLDAVQGFSVYNQPLQWATFARTAGLLDQADVPADQQKPLGYFDALYGVSGLQPSSIFVEDGSFLKLREASLRYRISPEHLGSVPGLERLAGVTLSLSGRNLITWTDYRGFDPEVGKTGGETGSAALMRVEGYQYPNFRTWTFGAEVNF